VSASCSSAGAAIIGPARPLDGPAYHDGT